MLLVVSLAFFVFDLVFFFLSWLYRARVLSRAVFVFIIIRWVFFSFVHNIHMYKKTESQYQWLCVFIANGKQVRNENCVCFVIFFLSVDNCLCIEATVHIFILLDNFRLA